MNEFISPGQIDEVIDLVTRHGTGWILAFVFFSMFVENVFPPYPGDAVIFAAGFISGSGKLSVAPLLVLSIIGSVASIMVVYAVGRRYGRAIFERRLLRFLGPDNLPKIQSWFGRYGTRLILASRFLAGTRALIALSAGVGGISAPRMALFSTLSVIVWNCLVILSAYHLHSNWEAVYEIFSTYNRAIFVVVIAVVAFFVIRAIVRRRRG
jgi:membrane protein DedA with SNARE-associated domain